ncbi:hypothetical protein Tco_0503166 [Tanacetum coccineum]
MEGHMERQYQKPKRKRDATWLRDKVRLVEGQGSGKVLNEGEFEFLADPRIVKGPVTQTIITHNAAYQADDLDEYDSDCDDFSTAKAVLMANLSSYGSNVLSEKAQQIRPMLYDGSVIAKETNVISIADSEETLMLEEESRSKMLLKQSDPMVLEKKVNIKPINYAKLNQLSEDFVKGFVPQQELSDEQAFRLQIHTLILTNLLLRLLKLRLLGNFLSVKKDIDEIETINIELEHRVTKLIAENEHLKQTYKQLYDSIKPSRVRAKEHAESLVNQLNQKSVEITDLNAQLQEKVFFITALKNALRKFKGKDIVYNAAQVSNATTIAPGMYKLDPVTLAPKDKNNRETHIYYLKHTMEQAAILREIVE